MKKSSLFLLMTDILLLSASFYTAFITAHTANSWYFKSFSPLYIIDEYTGAFVFALVSYLFSFYVMGLYDPSELYRNKRMILNILFAVVAGTVVVTILYFFLPHWRQGRIVLLLNACFAFLLILCQHKLYSRLRMIARKSEAAVIVGDIDTAKKLLEGMEQHRPHHNLDMLGVISNNKSSVGTELFQGAKVLGTFEDVESVLTSRQIKVLVVCRKTELPPAILSKLLDIKFRGVKIIDAGHLYIRVTGKVPVFLIDDEWWLTNEGFTLLHNRIVRHLRRFADFILGLLAVAVLSPIFVVVSALIKLTSKGPVFYRQQRVGEQDKVFTLTKFRTMVDAAESDTGPVWAQEKDPRVTPVGRFLRRTRLDEIPQFLNILKGDMSLIGPRPERPEFVKELERRIPYYGFRHMVKPGLTGWAQVMHPYGASFEDAVEKLQYELYYIQEMSLWLDVIILLKTVGTVIRKKGS